MSPITILVANPQHPSITGLTVSIDQLLQTLSRTAYTAYCVYKEQDQYFAYDYKTNSITATSRRLRELVSFIRPTIVIGVAWHTWSECLLLHASSLGAKTVLWSHGHSSLLLYKSKPIISCLRILSRLHQLLRTVYIIHAVDILVCAYRQTTWTDVRSVDYLIASISKKRVVIIPNSVDCTFWRPCFSRITKTQIITQARAEWQKGFLQVASLLNSIRIPAFRYIWISPHQISSTHNLFNKTIIDHPKLHCLSSLPLATRRSYLTSSLCYISLSQTEYQSISILEALSCGIPVITYPTGWTLSREIPGVITVRSPQEAADAVTTLFYDQQLWHKLSEQARRYTLQSHSTHTIGASWQHLLGELIQ